MRKVPKCCKCDEPSAGKRPKKYNLCARHHRFVQMRNNAHTRGLPIPLHEELERLFQSLRNMLCPKCSRRMNWLQKDGADTVVSLQHYRSGEFGFLCLSCNSRHRAYEGDNFMSVPETHKKCPGCQSIKHLDEFGFASARRLGKKVYCRLCANRMAKQWRDSRQLAAGGVA